MLTMCCDPIRTQCVLSMLCECFGLSCAPFSFSHVRCACSKEEEDKTTTATTTKSKITMWCVLLPYSSVSKFSQVRDTKADGRSFFQKKKKLYALLWFYTTSQEHSSILDEEEKRIQITIKIIFFKTKLHRSEKQQ